jgi:tRNA A-37 threonylcarbamoyl transferase component Bud32
MGENIEKIGNKIGSEIIRYLDKEEFDKVVNLAENYLKNPKNFLGEGGAAKVYIIEDYCMKIMNNRHKRKDAHIFDLGNSPAQEFSIQNTLRNLNINGVRVPKPIAFYEGVRKSAIFMERLHAVNMQMVLNGEQKIPSNFDLNNFFEKLEEFIPAMHKEGVVHNDLEPRNIMIDIKTGLPWVIDFGRSRRITAITPDKEKIENEDMVKVDLAYDKVDKFLSKINNKLYGIQ